MYKYLGTNITCNINYEKANSRLVDAAGRSLGAIICKMIKNGGFSYRIYSKLVEACVHSISDYSGEVIGYKSYDESMKLYLRTACAFCGVSKSAPKPGIIAEINWLLPVYRTQLKMVRQYYRLASFSNNRLSKKVFLWDKFLNNQKTVCTWNSEVRYIFEQNNLPGIYDNVLNYSLKNVITNLRSQMLLKQQNDFKMQFCQFSKLDSLLHYKNFNETPAYLTLCLSFREQSVLSKARLGILELRLETCRYMRPVPPREQQTCLVCPHPQPSQLVEDIYHFLFICKCYSDLRSVWL